MLSASLNKTFPSFLPVHFMCQSRQSQINRKYPSVCLLAPVSLPDTEKQRPYGQGDRYVDLLTHAEALSSDVCICLGYQKQKTAGVQCCREGQNGIKKNSPPKGTIRRGNLRLR